MSQLFKTRAQVAQACGVSLSTVDGWLAMGCPGTHRNYDLEAIQAWRAARAAKQRPATREEIVQTLAGYLSTGDRVPADISAKIERRFGSHHTIEIFAEARRIAAQGTTDA